jgi:hypothetical protein
MYLVGPSPKFALGGESHQGKPARSGLTRALYASLDPTLKGLGYRKTSHAAIPELFQRGR